MRALQHANFTFAKKISHTADSQDQRHRMVPGSRPLLMLTDTRSPDFVTPMLIAGNARAREVYERAMADAWAAKNELLDRGAPPRNRAVSAAERESHSPRRNRIAAAPAAQVDHAHLLQRAGRDLPGLDGRGRAGPRRASFARAIPRAAVLHPRRDRHADLHRRLALLRRESLAGISKNRAANLIARASETLSETLMTRRGSLVYYLASWICGGLFLTVAMYLQERASPEGMGIGPSGAGAAIITRIFWCWFFARFCRWCLRFCCGFPCAGCTPRASGSGRWPGSFSLCHDLGSALGVARDGRGGVARRWPPDRSFTFSRRARHRRTSPHCSACLWLHSTPAVLFLIHRAFSQKAES